MRNINERFMPLVGIGVGFIMQMNTALQVMITVFERPEWWQTAKSIPVSVSPVHSMFKFLNFLQPDSWKSHSAARYCTEAVGPRRPRSLPTICLPEGIN